jgi:Rhs element Vgr protein
MNSLLVLTHNNKLVIKPPDTNSQPVKEITYGKEVIEFESETDARSQRSEVKSFSWDYKDQAVKEWEETEVPFTENGSPAGKELAEKLVKNTGLMHGGYLKEEELKTWSSAQLLKSRMAKNIGRVRIKGVTDVHPGLMIKLNGFGKRFNGNVLVTAVRHSYKTTIWETDIHFGLAEEWFYEKEDLMEKPASGMVPGIHGLHIGVVTQLENDPDKEDRIKIKLPMVNGEDSIWARVASLDAGDERGAFFRPEISDEVVVGFLSGDPRHPVVLGMLHSSAKPAPIQAEDENHQKGFVTRSKLKLLFDDEKKTISLETPAGKKIVVSEDEDVIVFSDQHNNKIQLAADGIVVESGKDITLKTASGVVKIEANNIKLDAKLKLTANGASGADLTSSGQTVVKGAMVNIN